MMVSSYGLLWRKRQMDSARLLDEPRLGLTLNALKTMAVAAMVIDHIAVAFVPEGTALGILMHFVGRITGR